jgi:hypothetical protein
MCEVVGFLKVVFAFFVCWLLSRLWFPFLPSIIKSNGWRDSNSLTNNQGVLLGEFVSGNLEVQGGGTLANTAGNVVM